MVWNFNFSMITTLVLCLLLIYFFIKPRMPVVLNDFFVAILLLELGTLLTDVIASAMDMHHENYPVWMLYLFNGVYFACFIARSFVFFGYTITLLRLNRHNTCGFTVGCYILYILMELSVVLCPLTGGIFSIDPEKGYVKGDHYMVIYVCLFFYLGAGLVCLIIRRKIISRTGFVSMTAAHILLIAGGICRWLFPQILLMNTFFMLAIMILFLSFENADLYMEKRTNTFNYQAFERVIRERVAFGKKFWFSAAMARNYSESREIYGGVQMDQALGQIGQYFRKTFRGKVIFYERNGCFIVMGKNGKDRNKIKEMIRKRFSQSWAAYDTLVDIHLVYAEMDPELEITSAQQLVECLRQLFDKVSMDRELDLQRLIGAGKAEDGILIDSNMLSAMEEEFRDRKALKNAIKDGNILAYMQPLIEAKTGRVIGAEALARIEDEERGLIPPFRFIPIAEKNGSIGLLGEQVFEKVCRFLSEYAKECPLEFVNVNLSPIQCMNRELADKFDQIIRKYGVKPEKIHLEITEESLVDMNILHWQMDRLIRRGFSFALDDFGSGYANQFKVKEYPFSGVKLDMSIVREHFESPDRMLPDSVSMFLDRGLTVTAEGIETKEMADGMRTMGVNYLQGYYFAKPMPMEMFVDFVKKYVVK